jgi:hypothetical protein
MANTKISALPAATNLTSAELPIAQGGVTKKISAADLNTHIQTTLVSTTISLGVVELATTAEVSAGTDTARVLTPDTYRNAIPYYISRSTSYNLALTDRNTDQWCTAALTANIPAESGVAFDIGTSIPFLRIGSGTVTIDANGAVTLNGVLGGSCTIRTQYQGALLKKIGNDNWVISGDVSAVV